MGLCLNWIARFDAETDCKLGFLLNPSLGFISKIGSEKKVTPFPRPPHPLPPLYILCLTPTSPIFAFLPPPCKGNTHLFFPSLAFAQNKFVMKMVGNDHHGPARKTQGESDITLPPTHTPSLVLVAIEPGASGTPVPQIICILSFLQAARDVAYCLASR